MLTYVEMWLPKKKKIKRKAEIQSWKIAQTLKCIIWAVSKNCVHRSVFIYTSRSNNQMVGYWWMRAAKKYFQWTTSTNHQTTIIFSSISCCRKKNPPNASKNWNCPLFSRFIFVIFFRISIHLPILLLFVQFLCAQWLKIKYGANNQCEVGRCTMCPFYSRQTVSFWIE